MIDGYLTIDEVAQVLERHADRIEEAVAFGEWPACRGSTGDLLVPVCVLPPRRQVSEEEG